MVAQVQSQREREQECTAYLRNRRTGCGDLVSEPLSPGCPLSRRMSWMGGSVSWVPSIMMLESCQAVDKNTPYTSGQVLLISKNSSQTFVSTKRVQFQLTTSPVVTSDHWRQDEIVRKTNCIRSPRPCTMRLQRNKDKLNSRSSTSAGLARHGPHVAGPLNNQPRTTPRCRPTISRHSRFQSCCTMAIEDPANFAFTYSRLCT